MQGNGNRTHRVAVLAPYCGVISNSFYPNCLGFDAWILQFKAAPTNGFAIPKFALTHTMLQHKPVNILVMCRFAPLNLHINS